MTPIAVLLGVVAGFVLYAPAMKRLRRFLLRRQALRRLNEPTYWPAWIR